jgi:hypothetical protein
MDIDDQVNAIGPWILLPAEWTNLLPFDLLLAPH